MLPQLLQILPTTLFDQFISSADSQLSKKFDALKDSELSAQDFSFYISVSAVYSSRIEGENIELDSYIKHKRLGGHYQPDYTRKTDDLYEAYEFAKRNTLNEDNIAKAHALITRHILAAPARGQLRTGNMYVLTNEGKIEYVAAAPGDLKKEIRKFYADIEVLSKTTLTLKETFFFASLIHLVFVKIHPFEGGNGRTARLLEKWFLAQKLGDKAWYMESEKYYYQRHQLYYKNIRLLGLEYELLNYNEALPFLQMLSDCLNN